MNVLRSLKNHWKKTVFAAVVVSYGCNYGVDNYRTEQMMLKYCQRAQLYGKEPIQVSDKLPKVTVVLNPVSNKKRAMKNFEKYCGPILHLAGLEVDIVQTENETQARTIAQQLYNEKKICPDKNSDDHILVIAGGDGTISEVLTGIFRNTPEDSITFGVLPLGLENNFIKKLIGANSKKPIAEQLAELSLAIVEKVKKPVAVLKIESDENQPIYSVSGLESGCFRDLNSISKKYWYFGNFRSHFGYLYNTYWYKEPLTYQVSYKDVCSGCSNCRQLSSHSNSNWINRYLWRKNIKNFNMVDYSSIINDQCKNTNNITLNSVYVSINPTINDNILSLSLNSCPESVRFFDILKHGVKSTQEELTNLRIPAREILLTPIYLPDTSSRWFNIDGEEFEMKPVKLSILNNFSFVYCF